MTTALNRFPVIRALDLFAGTGWGVACQWLGIDEKGVEIMPEAIATREANGMETVFNDVWDGLEDPFIVPFHRLQIASPPCQAFSMAGHGAGRKALDDVLSAVYEGLYTDYAELREFARQMGDERIALVLTPLAYAHEWRPEFIAWEQVPPVLPVWEACATVLREWGYSVETGILNAEQYGVPQTRRRAILVASRVAIPRLPWPTHSKFHTRTPERIDEPYLPWVSMAEALDWPESLVGFPRKDDGRAGGVVTLNGVDYRGRDFRDTDQPSLALTEKARSWKRFERLPKVMAAAGTSCTPTDPRLISEPAATITGMGTAEWGRRVERAPGPKSRDPEGIRVEPWEAGVIQSFPADYPWQGTRTSQFKQVGNAVPPRLAAAYLKQFVEPQEMSNAG